jgi:hypothetical protein
MRVPGKRVVVLADNSASMAGGGAYFCQSRFSAKALPEGDLRYFSNAKACFSSANAT